MGTVRCPAGHMFSDGEIPSPYAWKLISDLEVEAVLDELVGMASRGEDIDTLGGFLIGSHSLPAYICPECGRLLVFEDGLDKPAASYKRE